MMGGGLDSILQLLRLAPDTYMWFSSSRITLRIATQRCGSRTHLVRRTVSCIHLEVRASFLLDGITGNNGKSAGAASRDIQLESELGRNNQRTDSRQFEGPHYYNDRYARSAWSRTRL